MGQAKNRGNREQRIAQAKDRVAALRPAFIVCNDCKAEITEIMDLDTRGMSGIEAGFAGICPHCKASTYAIKGDPQAVEAMMLAFAETNTGPLLVGIQ